METVEKAMAFGRGNGHGAGAPVARPDAAAPATFSEFLRRVMSPLSRSDKGLTWYESKAAMAGTSGPTGGYLLPESLRDDLLKDVAEESIFAAYGALRVPSETQTIRLPKLNTTTATAGVSPFFGGFQMYWLADAAARTESEPAFEELSLTAWDLAGYAYVSNNLMADAALEPALRRIFARAIVWYSEYAFLAGNGVGKPLGVINSPATLSFTRTTSSHVKYQDVSGMLAKLIPASRNRAVWVYHPSVEADLLQLTDGSNRAMQLAADVELTPWCLVGRPAISSEKVPALGTKGDLTLFDPTLYVVGDRLPVAIDVSRHEPTAFGKNQSAWRVFARVAGAPWLDAAVTLADGTQTASAYVVLN